MKTKETYCTICRAVKEHTAQVDKNGEFLFTCPEGHFFKVAADTPVAEIRQELAGREEAHKDIVTVEEEQKKIAEAETVVEEL